MSKDTRTFEVATPLRHDGERYGVGEPVEMTERQAAPLLEIGALREPKGGADAARGTGEPPADAERHARLVAAIAELDPENEAHFTKGGKPECDALATVSGIESVSAKERDAAWAEYQAQQAGGSGE